MIRAIIFDVDGVLLDSTASNILLFQDVIAKFGFPRPSAKRVLQVYGHSSHSMYKMLLPQKVRLSKNLYEKMRHYAYSRVPLYAKKVKLMAGLRRLLPRLAKKYRLGIATNRGRPTTEYFLKKFSIKKFFKAIITLDDVKRSKPHREPIQKVIKKLRVKPTEAIFVGDTRHDLVAGRAARVKTVFFSTARLRGYDYRLSNFGQLAGLLRKIGDE